MLVPSSGRNLTKTRQSSTLPKSAKHVVGSPKRRPLMRYSKGHRHDIRTILKWYSMVRLVYRLGEGPPATQSFLNSPFIFLLNQKIFCRFNNQKLCNHRCSVSSKFFAAFFSSPISSLCRSLSIILPHLPFSHKIL